MVAIDSERCHKIESSVSIATFVGDARCASKSCRDLFQLSECSENHSEIQKRIFDVSVIRNNFLSNSSFQFIRVNWRRYHARFNFSWKTASGGVIERPLGNNLTHWSCNRSTHDHQLVFDFSSSSFFRVRRIVSRQEDSSGPVQDQTSLFSEVLLAFDRISSFLRTSICF